MTFYGNHLVPRRGRVLPRPIRRPLPVIPCRAAPMCAAADIRRIPNGGAHWLRPTVVLPTPHPMSRTAPSNPVIARSGATWQSVLLLHRISDLCVGAGFYPARFAAPSQLSPVGRHPCVPPPTYAASPTAGHTGSALQSFYQLRTPCRAPHHQTLSLRGAERRGNPYSFCTASPTYA